MPNYAQASILLRKKKEREAKGKELQLQPMVSLNLYLKTSDSLLKKWAQSDHSLRRKNLNLTDFD